MAAGRNRLIGFGPAFSALGLLVADYVVDVVRSYVTPLSRVDLDRLHGLMQELGDETDKELAPADLPDSAVTRELFVQMAYAGQNFDMSVPCPEGATLDDAGLLDLADRFHHRTGGTGDSPSATRSR